MRGRPVSSEIRNNILEILNFKKRACGYELYQYYLDLFPKVHIRSIYYHLRKGVETGEVEVHEIKEEQGEYSWGNRAEKVYYTLGNNANVKGIERVRKYFKRQGLE